MRHEGTFYSDAQLAIAASSLEHTSTLLARALVRPDCPLTPNDLFHLGRRVGHLAVIVGARDEEAVTAWK